MRNKHCAMCGMDIHKIKVHTLMDCLGYLNEQNEKLILANCELREDNRRLLDQNRRMALQLEQLERTIDVLNMALKGYEDGL